MAGRNWLRFARNWVDEPTVDRMIEPLVADWQHELRTVQGWTSVTVRLRGHLALARSVLSCLLRQSRQPLPGGVAVKAWYLVEAFSSLGVLLVWVVLSYTQSEGSRPPFDIALPGTLTVVLPLVAVPLLVAMTRIWHVTPQVARWLAVRTALLLTLAMVPLAGWIAPRVHHGWRESVVGHQLPLALHQMTLPELWAGSGDDSLVLSTARRHQVHNRLSIIVMPISLSVLGLAVARIRRRAGVTIARAIGGATLWWITAALVWFASFPATAALLSAANLDPVAWAFAPWGTHVAMLLISVALVRLRPEHEPAHAR